MLVTSTSMATTELENREAEKRDVETRLCESDGNFMVKYEYWLR